MLKNDFYTISSLNIDGNVITTMIALNSEHPIFASHFSGQPVVPGACQLQIVKEMISHVLDLDLILSNATELKFLQIIDPTKNKEIKMSLTYDTATEDMVQVLATILTGSTICLKFKGSFRILHRVPTTA